MFYRRVAFTASVFLATAALIFLLAGALGEGGWTAAKLALLACFAALAPWNSLTAANGIAGFAILLFTRDPVRAVFPSGPDAPAPARLARTALLLTVRAEDIRAPLAGLRRLLDALDAAGHGAAFALFVLSDTADPLAAAAEQEAVAAFRRADPCPDRIRYRRRAANTGFKAGNVMDFVDHHAGGFTFMLPLDADSVMAPRAVLRMIWAMQADPGLGVIQHLTVGLPAASPFARLFQFGMRAGMRSWATGEAWWQGADGRYWGHNALIRIAPFRAYCRLSPLPDGSPILSHDQVEAVMMTGAGFAVRVLPEEDGSWEAMPPALPEFLQRDSRWQRGNWQYRHLLRAPGLRWSGRWQLAQAILMFAIAPLQVLLLVCCAWLAVRTEGPPIAAGSLAAITLAWLAVAHAPKLLGYAETLLWRGERDRYGGGARFVLGAIAEFVFSLMLEPICAVSRTLGFLRPLVGRAAPWPAQNRSEREIGWREAGRLFWPHSALGAALLGCFAAHSWIAALWATPFIGGLLLAVPFCVLTSRARLGGVLRRHGICAIPEEIAPETGHPDPTFCRGPALRSA